MPIVLGLCGENGSGKTYVADYIVKRGFVYYSLSDIIRDMLKKESKEPTRENMQKKGEELVKVHGPGVLGKLIRNYVDPNVNTVVDSIRRVEEVEELKKIPGFALLYVTAPEEIRFKRIKERNRPGDPKTLEEFRKIERIETEGKGNTGQNIKLVSKLADEIIVNDGMMLELNQKLDILIPNMMKKYAPPRLTWDEYFMKIAQVVAERSSCIKRRIGAVIVRDKQILSTGYNGTPRGITNCNEGGCPRCNSFEESGKNLHECFCSHAEENAIVQAAYNGISVKGGTIYTTFSPCLYCARMIINSGIKEVVYNSKYPLAESSFKLLEEAGIKVREFKVR